MAVTSAKRLAYMFRVLSATTLLVLLNSNASGHQTVSLITYSIEINNGMALTLCESNRATMLSSVDHQLHSTIQDWFRNNRNTSITTYWIAHNDCAVNECSMMNNNTMKCIKCSDRRLVFCKKERPCQYVKNITSALYEQMQEADEVDCEQNCCAKRKCIGWSFSSNGCYHYNSSLNAAGETSIMNTKQPLNIIHQYVQNTTLTDYTEVYPNFEVCEGYEESSNLSETSTQTPCPSSPVESTAEMTSMLTYSSSYETDVSSLSSFIHATSCSSTLESTQIPSDIQTTSNWPEKTSTEYTSFSVFSTTLEIYSSTTQSLDCNGGACTSSSSGSSESSGSSGSSGSSESSESSGSSGSSGSSESSGSSGKYYDTRPPRKLVRWAQELEVLPCKLGRMKRRSRSSGPGKSLLPLYRY
ncbi:uncharacterized protein LOC106873133 [Octopus bimaculoides]|uniref:uncharacterized protein LOC106873133 n=1 Tax=Octopus bimaculoides TaxID=37653 RepID=UPI0022E4EAB4|nr:uncharacterized protein LOC106873133 [Octopus bimaculoides]